ncbi:hypothetical protein AADZ90_008985 [Aestuariibius sp. 2305UL40-4]|uniref:hypothetical protein n=1 Tax=Aestuariibius violaceus TaxID=3234132 RepID=UPI00345EEE39
MSLLIWSRWIAVGVMRSSVETMAKFGLLSQASCVTGVPSEALSIGPCEAAAAFGSKDALYREALDRYTADGRARLYGLTDELDRL